MKHDWAWDPDLGSWFLAFKVSWFQSFSVSKFLGFKVSKICQISISCFLDDIDPISKIFKNLSNGSSEFVGARLLEVFKMLDSQHFEIYQHDISQK